MGDSKADGLSATILQALSQGYDVEVRIRRRDDGKEGEIRIPIPWARKFGMSDSQIEELKLK